MEKLYLEFKDAYISAYPDLRKDLAYQNLQKIWNDCKSKKDDIKRSIAKVKTITAKRRSKLMSMWSKVAAANSSRDSATISGDSKSYDDVNAMPVIPSVHAKTDDGKTDIQERVEEASNKPTQNQVDQDNLKAKAERN